MLSILFGLSLACVAYTFAGYPLLLAVVTRWRSRPFQLRPAPPPTLSVILAAYNEESNIGRRVAEFRRLLEQWPAASELLVVSDGSTDRTAAIVRAECDERIRLIELPQNRGKAHALSRAAQQARHEILVFADARQRWASDALERLVEPFSDPTIGAVSGELILESAPGVLSGVGLYWRLEKQIRAWESLWHSCVGVTGCIAAVRRELFAPIPTGTVLDDVYWPLRVVLQGRRVILHRPARAFDHSPAAVTGEFQRKVRTLAGNLQLIQLLPSAFLPGRNPIWFQLISHKLCRLLAPWALMVALITCAMLPGWPSRLLLGCQLAGYALALIGLHGRFGRFRLPASAAAFLVLNAAATAALWVWLTSNGSIGWSKQRYH
ncbi:MAG: glycosyl transferase [Isosphaeraceae bacterium]|nr:MAG: glycosyl transferase [Isosphaeraceae bacterium]